MNKIFCFCVLLTLVIFENACSKHPLNLSSRTDFKAFDSTKQGYLVLEWKCIDSITPIFHFSEIHNHNDFLLEDLPCPTKVHDTLPKASDKIDTTKTKIAKPSYFRVYALDTGTYRWDHFLISGSQVNDRRLLSLAMPQDTFRINRGENAYIGSWTLAAHWGLFNQIKNWQWKDSNNFDSLSAELSKNKKWNLDKNKTVNQWRDLHIQP